MKRFKRRVLALAAVAVVLAQWIVDAQLENSTVTTCIDPPIQVRASDVEVLRMADVLLEQFRSICVQHSLNIKTDSTCGDAEGKRAMQYSIEGKKHQLGNDGASAQ